MNKTLDNVIRLIFVYIIVANIITVKYLYDVREIDECKNTPMLTFVYDYYLLELGTAITLLLLSFIIGNIFTTPKIVSHKIIPFISKSRNILFTLSFIINCIFFFVLYEISTKKICNDVHPYLTYYLMYNSSSNILAFIYIVVTIGFQGFKV
tara:strand:+ start:5414 stop:5869 length:456 start_codon:yes stop_codon:yes gene_type:complete